MFERLRKQAGFTQTELARALNVKQNTVSYWETGKAKPDILTAAKIAEVFGVPVEDIINCFIDKSE